MGIIEATFAPDGTVKIEGVGIVGPSCEKLIQTLSDAVGTTTSAERTADYYLDERAKADQ